MSKQRYALLDTLRGLCLVNMILYHTVYDLRFLFPVLPDTYPLALDHVWQQTICWGFLLLSGACCALSHHPVRRGALLLGCGWLIEGMTALVMPSQRVRFGILSCIGCAMILVGLARHRLERLSPAYGTALSFGLFLLLYGVPRGYLGMAAWGWRVPALWYQTRALAPLGLPHPTFFSADYFPLVPWLFLYLTGFFVFRLLVARPSIERVLTASSTPLAFLGRHSLPIYLVHQPVLYGVLWLILGG